MPWHRRNTEPLAGFVARRVAARYGGRDRALPRPKVLSCQGNAQAAQAGNMLPNGFALNRRMEVVIHVDSRVGNNWG